MSDEPELGATVLDAISEELTTLEVEEIASELEAGAVLEAISEELEEAEMISDELRDGAEVLDAMSDDADEGV